MAKGSGPSSSEGAGHTKAWMMVPVACCLGYLDNLGLKWGVRLLFLGLVPFPIPQTPDAMSQGSV